MEDSQCRSFILAGQIDDQGPFGSVHDSEQESEEYEEENHPSELSHQSQSQRNDQKQAVGYPQHRLPSDTIGNDSRRSGDQRIYAIEQYIIENRPFIGRSYAFGFQQQEGVTEIHESE